MSTRNQIPLCFHKAALMDNCSVPPALENEICSLFDQIPWLMLPDNDPHCGFCDLSTGKILRIEFPEAYSNRCCGSSHGWLVMVDKSPSVFMINPLTRHRIQLPPITTFPDVLYYYEEEVGSEYGILDGDREFACEETFDSELIQSLYMNKVILSGNPSLDEDYTAMAIYSLPGRLGFCKSGDKQWYQVSERLQLFINDVIYWKEKKLFYAISRTCELVICDLKDPDDPVVEVKKLKFKPGAAPEKSYLVVSSGELLLVLRNRWEEMEEEKLMYGTTSFEVYKLYEETASWDRIKSIGDRILFVGVNAAESLSAADFPACKANHIYFTDNYDHYDPGVVGGHDLGAMNLETNELLTLAAGGCCSEESSCFIWPHPVWMVPSHH